jgi:hypothetical protein
MAQASLAFRITARTTSVTDTFGEDETGIGADHIGDPVIVMSFDHQWSAKERTKLGIVKVTNVPDAKAQIIKQRLEEESLIAKVTDNLGGGWVLISGFGYLLRRPRRFRVDKALALAEFPSATTIINRLFDTEDEVAQEDIPTLSWTKFKTVLVDKSSDSQTTGDEFEEDVDPTEA